MVLTVDLVAGGGLLAAISKSLPNTSVPEWLRAAAIALAAIIYAELFDRVERLRRFLGEGRAHNNHQSVWAVAAFVVASPAIACAVVALTYLHSFVVLRRHQALRPYRATFTAATAVCGTWAGAALLDAVAGSGMAPLRAPGTIVGVVVAVAAMFAVNTGLVAAVMRLTSDRRGRELLPPSDALWFEASTIVLGIVGAQLLISTWWLAPAVLGGLVALHRAALVTKLQLASATDLKTGLLNAATWCERARKAVRDAGDKRQRVALIAVDLDHFKRVNDEHGHLVGDQVLCAVAGVLSRETRASDVVGRFGGEEFFVLVTGMTAAAHAVDLATRLRASIAALELPHGLRVTASLGITHEVPVHGDLDTLISAADEALYAAKDLGRDRVYAARPA